MGQAVAADSCEIVRAIQRIPRIRTRYSRLVESAASDQERTARAVVQPQLIGRVKSEDARSKARKATESVRSHVKMRFPRTTVFGVSYFSLIDSAAAVLGGHRSNGERGIIGRTSCGGRKGRGGPGCRGRECHSSLRPQCDPLPRDRVSRSGRRVCSAPGSFR